MLLSQGSWVPSPRLLVQTANNCDLALARDSTVELPAATTIGGEDNSPTPVNKRNLNSRSSSSCSAGSAVPSTTTSSENSSRRASCSAAWGVCDNFEVDAWDRRLRATGCLIISPLTLLLVNSAHPIAYAAPITYSYRRDSNSSSTVGLVSGKWITATCGRSTARTTSGAVAAEAIPRLHAAFQTVLAAMARNGTVQGSMNGLPLGFGLACCADADVAQLTDAIAQLLALELEASDTKPLATRSAAAADTSASADSSAAPTPDETSPPTAVAAAALPPPFPSLTEMELADATTRATITCADPARDAAKPYSTLSERLHDSRSSYGSYGSSGTDDDGQGAGIPLGFDFSGPLHESSGLGNHVARGDLAGFGPPILGSLLPGQDPFNSGGSFAPESFGRNADILEDPKIGLPHLATGYSLADLLLKSSAGAPAAAPVSSDGASGLSNQASCCFSSTATGSAALSSTPDSSQAATQLRAAIGLSAGAHEFRPATDLSASPLAAPGLAGPSGLSPEVAAWVPGGGREAAGAGATGGKPPRDTKAEGNWSRDVEAFPRKSLVKPPGFYSMW